MWMVRRRRCYGDDKSRRPKLLCKIREERRSDDLTQLTDAELVAKLARALSNDKGNERLKHAPKTRANFGIEPLAGFQRSEYVFAQ